MFHPGDGLQKASPVTRLKWYGNPGILCAGRLLMHSVSVSQGWGGVSFPIGNGFQALVAPPAWGGGRPL